MSGWKDILRNNLIFNVILYIFFKTTHCAILQRYKGCTRRELAKRIYELLLEHAQIIKDSNGRGIEDGKVLRLDCTVAETNIAFPLIPGCGKPSAAMLESPSWLTTCGK